MLAKYRKFSLSALATTIAGALTLFPALAEEPKTDAKPLGKATSAQSNVAVKEVAIPSCLGKLTLTQPQQDQIRAVVVEYDADLVSVWKQFSDRYLETIQTEALLLAAIEDNLTDPQRKQARDQRRKTARHQKAVASTDDKPNLATSQPTSAVEQEITIVGISLTAEQEIAADKLQEAYLRQLRSLNRDIQGLHIRLVSLEADKLVEIENLLTEEQLVQLRANRQNAPVASNAAAERASPAKTE